MISFHQHSNNNKITINSSSIRKNIATRTGGGIVIMTWGNSSNNTISITDSEILENQAVVGGGGKVLLQSKYHRTCGKIVPTHHYIRFQNVNFVRNRASSASGLHMIYNMALTDKPPEPVRFLNVRFTHHMTLFHSHLCEGPSAYAGEYT